MNACVVRQQTMLPLQNCMVQGAMQSEVQERAGMWQLLRFESSWGSTFFPGFVRGVQSQHKRAPEAQHRRIQSASPIASASRRQVLDLSASEMSMRLAPSALAQQQHRRCLFLRSSYLEARHRSAHHGAVRTLCSTSSAETKALPKLSPLDGTYESRHAFTPYANWIVPDAVMLGRYPFIEPMRCPSREQGEYQLEQILNAGIGTFVCLQDELPPQDKMKLGGKDGFLPYKSTAELIQSALNGPPPMELLDGSLRNPTLNRFLPPKRHHVEEQAQYKPKELHFLHTPIVDLGVPSQDAVKKLVPDLQARLEAGQKLYIHCWGGRGRSATVGACLLIWAYGIKADEALDRVQRAYATRDDPQPSTSPETEAQKQFVRSFAASLGR